MKLRKRRIAAVVLIAGVAILALGPRASLDSSWPVVTVAGDPDAYLAQQESRYADIRPDDARGIVWQSPDSHARTALSIVYLHGFSADRHEVEPLISDLGHALNANIYFARLRGHARTSQALGAATAREWLEDTAEAYTIGRMIGDSVIVIGSSTGGALAVWAATQPETANRVAALILLSPNLQLFDSRAFILGLPWGRQLARLITGKRERCISDDGYVPSSLQERHWTTCYPIDVLVQVQAVVQLVQNLEPASMTAPTLTFFSDRDTTIDTAASRSLLTDLHKGKIEFQTLTLANGDGHVVAGDIMAPEATPAVLARTLTFIRDNVVSLPASQD